MKTPLIDHKFKDLTDVLRGAAASLAGFAGRSGARFIYILFAGNFYGAVRLGELAAVIAVTEILVMLGIFGFRRSLMEFLENLKGDADGQYSLVKTALTVSLAASALVAGVLAYYWDFLGLIHRNSYYTLFALIIPVIALMDVLLTTTRFKRIIRYEVFARSLVEPWTLALSAVAFYFMGFELFGLLLAYALSLVAAFLFAAWAFGKEFSWLRLLRSKLNFGMIRKMGFSSGPTALVDAIGVAFRRIDILFLGYFMSDAIVGIYYGVQNIATVLQKTRHVFDPILSPVVNQTMNQRSIADAGQQLAQVCRWILTLLCLQLALMAFYSGPLLGVIGEGFAAGALALMIILSAEVIEGTFASAELPFVFKRPWFNFLLTFTAFSAHIVGLSLLVPRFGMIGAAISFTFAITLLNSMRLIAIWNKFRINLLRPGYLKPITAGTIAYFAIHYANQAINLKTGILVPVGIALGIGVYAAVFWVLKPSREDREFVAYLRGKKKPKMVVDKDFDQV